MGGLDYGLIILLFNLPCLINFFGDLHDKIFRTENNGEFQETIFALLFKEAGGWELCSAEQVL